MTTPEQGITLTRTIAAPPSKVYAAYTSAEGWCAWCCETAEVDPRVGGRYHIFTEGYNALGDFTDLEPDRSIAFTWDGDGEPPMRVQVRLEAHGGSTDMTFTVTILGSTEAGFAEFLGRTWGRVLDNLKAVLERQVGG